MNQQVLLEFVSSLNHGFIGPLLVILLLGTGLFFTIRLGFIQRYVVKSVKVLLIRNREGGKASKQEGMTPFQALATSIASQVGTGNIVGVATALAAGGPGALFWLWISTIVGMATNFSEAILGQLFRTQKDGHIIGGPAYYIRDGLKSKWLAGVFAVFLILALGVTGIMVQANSIINATSRVMPEGIEKLYIGIVLTVLTGLVLAGGITRIASFAEKIVPLMAGLFMFGSLIFICMHAADLPGVFGDVFRYAFTPWAPVGGALGATVMATMRYGVSRGLFSNEAGLGSTPHAHAIAKVKNPYDQGLIALIGIAVDLIVCTLTALVILLSGVLISNPDAVGVAIPQLAFGSTFGQWGDIFIATALFFFAFSTIVGWYFFAAQNVRYLFGEKLIWPYRILVMAVTLISSVTHVNLVWELADTFNFFLVVPNVIALIYLSPKVAKEVKRMQENFKSKDS